jgi:hypothetical protein
LTKLIVSPIDLAAPGSYRERKRFLRLLKRLRANEPDAEGVLGALEEVDALISSRLRTDDGTSVEDALDLLSAQQFDALLSAIAFEVGVGEVSTGRSNAGPEGSLAPSVPIG